MQTILCSSVNCYSRSDENSDENTPEKLGSEIANVFCDDCGPLCSMCSISKHTFSRSSHRTIGINLQLCADDFRRSLQKDVDKIKDGYQGYQDYLVSFQTKKTENERLKDLIVSELDKTDCIATDSEKRSLHLLREDERSPDFCFHKSCEKYEGSCFALHKKMQELLYEQRSFYKKKEDIESGFHHIIHYIMRSSCKYGFIDIIEQMIEKIGYNDLSVDESYRRTFLHEAVDYSQEEIVKKLLPLTSRGGIMHEQYHENASIRNVLGLSTQIFEKTKTEESRNILKMVRDRCIELCV